MPSVFDCAVPELGKPYAGPIVGQPESFRWGTPGWDCSSFVSGMFACAWGISLTAFTDALYRETVPVADPQAGDIVFYQFTDPAQPAVTFPHVGIYLDPTTVLDARFPVGVGYHPPVTKGTAQVRWPSLLPRPGDLPPGPGPLGPPEPLPIDPAGLLVGLLIAGLGVRFLSLAAFDHAQRP